MTEVKTRFAPSPTGYLHIGGARTALFNWLFAMKNNGKFYLRIEDTDTLRSTEKAINAIFNGLEWLDIKWEKEITFQSKNSSRYQEIVNLLLEKNKAYYCYSSPQELDKIRENSRKKGVKQTHNRFWRDKKPGDKEKNINPVVRFKAPLNGITIIDDLVQGEVKVKNEQLDDMILLRSDGTPTYMLSVVVDDYDMGITHVIRGDDHLNNAFRQINLFKSLDWKIPNYAHIPLIHNSDGKKLSKRLNSVGIEEYKEMGILSEAMKNYFLHLGLSYGDEEIISENNAIKLFSINKIRKSPSRFDIKKLKNINSFYIKNLSQNEIINKVKNLYYKNFHKDVVDNNLKKLNPLFDDLISRSSTLNEIYFDSKFLFIKNIDPSDEAQKIINNSDKLIFKKLVLELDKLELWIYEDIENLIKDFADRNELKLKEIAMPLRACITGNKNSPNIFKIIFILGKRETLLRLGKFY